MFDVALVIGRFQPFHQGHAALLARALGAAERVLVVIGSDARARSPRNPWTSAEREALIRCWLRPQDQARVTFKAQSDHLYDEDRWSLEVRASVAEQAGPKGSVTLVAHLKDDTQAYLDGFPEWPVTGCDLMPGATGTAFRQSYLGSAETDDWQGLVPRETLPWLTAFRSTEAFQWLRREHQVIQDYRASWASAPYPPTLVTVDLLITAQDRVLLVLRGRSPGQGLFACPGGFLDGSERLIEAAVREVEEETGLVLSSTQRNQVLPAGVFDHPARSERGRMITHVFRLDLGDRIPPVVLGGDDAAEALWMPVVEALSHPERFFDDHHEILSILTAVRPQEAP